MWNERVVSGRSIDVIHWKASRRNDWRGSVPGKREIPQQKLFHNNFYEDTFHRITGKFPFPSPQSSIDHTLFMLPITTPITSKTFRLIPKTHHTMAYTTQIFDSSTAALKNSSPARLSGIQRRRPSSAGKLPATEA